MTQWDVVIIGAGPAGLMAAWRAARRGRKTLLVEKNRRPGVKILLAGGGRCNVTHATDRQGIVDAFGPSGRFLHSALAALGPQELIEILEASGVKTKAEAGGKVFPASDRASDVLAVLLAKLQETGCEMACDEPVSAIDRAGEGFRIVTAQRILHAETLLLATGGQSYPEVGTTGDGYRWVQALGHTIVPPRPALTPITTEDAWVRELQGITLPDVLLRVEIRRVEGPTRRAGRAPAESRGALLFAHFGLTGPAALDVSRAVSRAEEPIACTLVCDLVPEIKAVALEEALGEECQAAGGRRAAAVLARWTPQRVVEAVFQQAGVSGTQRAAEWTRSERRAVVQTLKGLKIAASGTLGFRKAEVTSGGALLAEVDSRTLQSKVTPHLFIAGELLDLDGPIGGFNLQAAFSTGWLAGESM